MKIEAFEKICDVFGGYYERALTKDQEYTLVTLHSCKHTLFPDELSIIKRRAKKEGFKLQYISYKSDGIGLEFIKKMSI